MSKEQKTSINNSTNRMKGLFYVVDYEHQGDIDRDIDRLQQIDNSLEVTMQHIYKEDPDADCETCELYITFDKSKLSELEKVVVFLL